MNVNTHQWQTYINAARRMGFLDLAAAPKGEVRYADRVRDWVADGAHARMDWYARGLPKRLDLTLVMEDAASVLMLTIPYTREPCQIADRKLARYACGDDYHDVLIKKLRDLCDLIKTDFPQANLRPYVDTGPILERYWAEEAGLGWIGKNGNLISRQHGSYLFLAGIVTNLTVPYGRRHEPFCGACRACIDACPTDAIITEGYVDSRRCISYLSIEHRGPFESQTPDFHDWVFGCDICQEVCPWTVKFAPEEVIEPFKPRPSYSQLDPETIPQMEQAEFSATFKKSPIKRTKIAGLLRNWAHLKSKSQPKPQ